jgi:hypothetical protein
MRPILIKPLAALSLLLSFVLLAGPALAAQPDCERVYGIGDIHGGYDALVSILGKTGLVDEKTDWSGGGACLVQTGDIVDRGERSREVLDLLMKLEAQAGGRLIVLLGNHEVMNLTGDLRYVARGEFGAYAADETAAERDAGFELFATTAAIAGLSEPEQRAAFDRAHPPGWFAHRRAFSPAGRYGRWLAGKPIAARVGGTLFVHGGLSLADAEAGIEALNRQAGVDLLRWVELREGLERAGLVDPLQPFGEMVRAVQGWVEENPSDTGEVPAQANELLALLKSPIFRSDGPLWSREFANQGEGYAPTVEAILQAAGARRVLVGHSTTEDHLAHARFGDRVFLMDTGAGPAYEGQVSTLEVARNGRVRAVYLDAEVVLGRPDAEWLERALVQGVIVESKPLGSGITKPHKLLIEWEGERIEAVFKSVDIERSGLTTMGDSTAEIGFTDSYRWGLAAYLLDKQLGLNMVPVAVERVIDGETGAVIEWIDDAISEADRLARQIDVGAASRRAEQVSIMLMFDALIYNVDRHPGNWLWTQDGQLYLIDHSRSFRLNRKLPDYVEDVPIRVPRWLYDRIRALDLETLGPLLSPLAGKARVKALLKRRDAFVAMIEQRRKANGDEFVFSE